MAEPRRVVRGETDGVVACFVGCEGEFTFERTGRFYDDFS